MDRTARRPALLALLAALLCSLPAAATGAVFFKETFEDANLPARGWYDGAASVALSTIERIPGSRSSLQYHFAQGATVPDKGAILRHAIPPTESIYISFYIKHSSNWVGSGKPYQPHEFYFMTNLESAWAGPAYTNLTVYVEENAGRGQIYVQDGKNIDQSRIGQNLVNVTEYRGVAGCNGDSDGYGNGNCYLNGSVYWNGKTWYTPVIFSNTAGPYYKADWHLVEAYFRLNAIVNGKGARDGIMQYWLDGKPVIDNRNVVYRTGKNPGMRFNQLMIGFYIGDGSPVAQTVWIDDLSIGDARPSAPELRPRPPANLQVR